MKMRAFGWGGTGRFSGTMCHPALPLIPSFFGQCGEHRLAYSAPISQTIAVDVQQLTLLPEAVSRRDYLL